LGSGKPIRTPHALLAILFLTLCAVICGMDDWEATEESGNERQDWLRQFGALENWNWPQEFSDRLAKQVR